MSEEREKLIDEFVSAFQELIRLESGQTTLRPGDAVPRDKVKAAAGRLLADISAKKTADDITAGDVWVPLDVVKPRYGPGCRLLVRDPVTQSEVYVDGRGHILFCAWETLRSRGFEKIGHISNFALRTGGN